MSVLEDLVAADRYRLLDMKRVCQSMVRLSADNCLQVCMCVYVCVCLCMYYIAHNRAIRPCYPSHHMPGVCVCVCISEITHNRAIRPCHPCYSMPLALILPRGGINHTYYQNL